MTERLEGIKKRLVLLHNAIDVDDETKNYIFKDLKVEWLIERVQELEELTHKQGKVIIKQSDELDIFDQQNKRYREALEFYADKKNYLEMIDPSGVLTVIEEDEGEKARKALEREG